MHPDPAGPPAESSVTALFSPRKDLDVLQWYADRLNDADDSAHRPSDPHAHLDAPAQANACAHGGAASVGWCLPAREWC